MTKNGMESENEFDVDEPEEVKQNDDWKPEQTHTRRQSSRLRVSRLPVILDTGSTDDDFSDVDSDFERLLPKKRSRGGRGGRRGRPPSKLARVSSTTSNGQAEIETAGSEDNSNAAQVSGSDTEPTSTTATTNSSSSVNHSSGVFQSGSFVVLKTDFKNPGDPPIWKIDGKALLQKYIPFQLDGKVFYKNTSVYSGWTINNKNQYYPCSIVFRQQNKKEHIIEFLKDSIKPEEDDENSKSGGEEDEVEDGDDEEEDEEEEGDDADNEVERCNEKEKDVDEEDKKTDEASKDDKEEPKSNASAVDEESAKVDSSNEVSEVSKEVDKSSVGPDEK